MQEKHFKFWQKWLTWANALTVVIGLLVAFAGNSFVFDLHNSYTKELFFEGQKIEGDILQFKNWLFGIIGGSIVGFHLLMIMISENSFKNKEPWAYSAMWIGLLSWFLIDSSISLYYGAVHNLLIINIVALVIIGLPLAMTKNAFKR